MSAGGGRRHTYQASVEAHKRLGQNYADLAVVLWEEMMGTRGGPQAAPAALQPDHRPAGRGLPQPGHGRRVGRAAGPAQPRPARPRGRGRGGPGRRRPGDRSCASTPARTTSWPRSIGPSAPWNERCSRRSWAAACGSASAGSTAIAPATSRPSRSRDPPGRAVRLDRPSGRLHRVTARRVKCRRLCEPILGANRPPANHDSTGPAESDLTGRI